MPSEEQPMQSTWTVPVVLVDGSTAEITIPYKVTAIGLYVQRLVYEPVHGLELTAEEATSMLGSPRDQPITLVWAAAVGNVPHLLVEVPAAS